MKKRSFLPLLFLFVVLISSHQSQAADCNNATYFHNTVWKSHNLGTKFISYHFLKSDGSVGYSKTPRNFKSDGTDTWKVDKGFLLLIWTNGYAMEKYRINSRSCKVLDGEKTSKSWKGKQPVRLLKVADDYSGAIETVKMGEINE